MPQTLVLEDVVDAAFDNTLQGVWTAVPGIVESYDASKQRASVRVAVKTVSVGQDGDTDVDDVAVINSVPVLHPGGGGFRIVFPVQRGDSVLLVFCSRAIDQWLTKGGVVDPQTDRHHDVSDVVAVTGLRDFGHALKSAPTDHASVGSDTGATIELYPTEVRLGGDAASVHVALSTDISTTLKNILTSSAVKSGIAAASTDGGTSYAAAINAQFALASFGATKVKAL